MIVAELLTKLGFKLDTDGLDKGKSALQEFKSFALKLGLGAAVAMIGRTAIQAAADIESMKAQFTTMLGDEQKAVNLMKQLQGYAARTTFETGDVTQVVQTLMAFGVEQKQAMDVMKRLGDVAGANKERFKSLGLAMAQVSSAGRLQGQDLLQLVNAGWNPLREISAMTGKSMADLRKDMEKGLISAEMVTAALARATSEGGMFYKNQERQAKTLMGVYSTMVDNLKIKLADMALAFAPALKGLMELVSKVDLTPLVEVFRWLAAAIQYVAEVAWNSGLHEAFFVFQEALSEVFGTMSDATAPARFEAVLKSLGQILGWVASAVLLAASTLLRLYRVLVGVAQFVWEWRALFISLGFVLLAVFGPAMVTQIMGFVGATRIATLWQTFFARAALASGAAVGYKVTMLGILKSALFSVQMGYTKALAAARAFVAGGAGGMMGVLAAVAFTAYQLYRLYNAIQELKAAEDVNARNERATKAIQGLDEDARELRLARERGDTASMQMLEARMKRKREEYRRITAENNAHWSQEDQMPSFEAIIKAGDQNSQTQMQKVVEGSQRVQNISNKTDVTIHAPQGADGKTGLGPSELGKLAEQVFRSQFSIQLRGLLVSGAA